MLETKVSETKIPAPLGEQYADRNNDELFATMYN